MQLGGDKYISEPEAEEKLPPRALVSLDIINMFNAISREDFRSIVATVFPRIEAFADMLYKESEETYVKMEDGSWAVIKVEEGFSQGCPVSPVFAAIVLNAILRKIQPHLEARARLWLSEGHPGDDGHGTLGLIMAYVDNVNVLLHHDDIEFFLDEFTRLARPRGGILNTTKTRIMIHCQDI